jgi:hypothetical protein
LLVPDERGQAAIYVFAKTAIQYYQVLTGERRMPFLVRQRI